MEPQEFNDMLSDMEPDSMIWLKDILENGQVVCIRRQPEGIKLPKYRLSTGAVHVDFDLVGMSNIDAYVFLLADGKGVVGDLDIIELEREI